MDAVPDKSNDLDALAKRLLKSVEAAADLAALDAIRVSALGKKGEISELMKQLGTMAARGAQKLRRRRQRRQGPGRRRASKRAKPRSKPRPSPKSSPRIAWTSPSPSGPTRPPKAASIPISRVWEELMVIFADMGFSVAEGPDIETDDYNFTRLNFPRRTSGARGARHLLLPAEGERRAAASAHAHLAGAGAHHAGAEAAHPHHRAGPRLPHGQRPDAHADVPPGRGPRHRPRHPYGPPQMGAGGVLQGILRGR